MIEASEIILSGFPLKVDSEIIKYPDRFYDERGSDMWDTIMRLLP